MSLQNGPFWLVKRPLLSAERGRFATLFGMYCKPTDFQLLTRLHLLISMSELSLLSCYTFIYRYSNILPFRGGLERLLPLMQVYQ